MVVTVYTPPTVCMACRFTKKRMDKLGIEYTEVPVDDALADELKAEGFAAYPVVKVDFGDGATTAFSGLKLDVIDQLAKAEPLLIAA